MMIIDHLTQFNWSQAYYATKKEFNSSHLSWPAQVNLMYRLSRFVVCFLQKKTDNQMLIFLQIKSLQNMKVELWIVFLGMCSMPPPPRQVDSILLYFVLPNIVVI